MRNWRDKFILLLLLSLRLSYSTNCLIKSITSAKEYLFIKSIYYLKVCVCVCVIYKNTVKRIYTLSIMYLSEIYIFWVDILLYLLYSWYRAFRLRFYLWVSWRTWRRIKAEAFKHELNHENWFRVMVLLYFSNRILS